ncbi:methyl-accepting chemotaxis protein [Vibrio sp. MA40-2]|uniref:methyl-accepting chemotaxis protein n=1 Tax=Vibrio sp. MA40-2 TaxID=3391828 RepID=UPI0039A680C3
MKFFSTLSIKNKLIIAMLFAVVVSTSVVAFVGQAKTKELLVTRLEQSDLPNLVLRVRNAVDSEILRMEVVAKSIANNVMILDWFEKGQSTSGEQNLIKYLENLANDNSFTNASFVHRETAKYWNQDGFLRTLLPERDSWFFQFKDSGKAESASVYYGSEGDVDIFVNYQQLSGQGAAGVSKSFKEMVTYLNSFQIEQTGFVYLVDSSGKVKVHKNQNFNENKMLSDIYPGIDSTSLINKKDFAFEAMNNALIASSYIPTLDWYVIAEVPTNELYAGLDRSRDYMIMTFIVISLVFIAVSIMLANSLVKPLNKMAVAFEELGEGEGDLTSKIDENGSEEIARLAKGFNIFVLKIRNVVRDVSTTALEVKGASEEVHRDSEGSRVSSDNQRDEAHQVSVAINEMGSTIAEIASNAGVAAHSTNEATEMTLNAQGVVTDSNSTITQMAENMEDVSSNIESLAQKTESISSVLDVIRGISEQTNLLALNAAIEAARAGEQGRGFAVVADEVRNLAQRTSESTDEIHKMITELQDGSKAAVLSVHEGKQHAELGVSAAIKTSEALQEIVGNIQHISDLNTQIATATEEQSAVINEINVHVVNISDSSDRSALSAASMEQSSESLKSMALTLDGLVKKFKV